MKQFLLILFLAPFISFAQYAISAIPDSLLKNSNVVERIYEVNIEIKNPGKAKINTRYAYTVLNEAGQRYAIYSGYYDKIQSVGSIKGTLFDASGKELKQVRKKEIMDLSGNDEDNLMYLMSDARFKVHRFYNATYPYTVEYEDERELDGVFDLPDWRPVKGSYMAVENSKLTITAPMNYKIRYKQFNYNGLPVITTQGDKNVYTWEIKNVPAKHSEIFGPAWDEINPTVLVAPSDFEIEGFVGNMDSWKNFGMFIRNLNEGRDVLPDHIKQKVHALTDNLKNTEDKVKLLYKFMQENTRYISIQLGIGGWRPFEANYVVNKKYGDCKALSNYMVALLKEAGIKANYVLIRGGDDEEDIVADFPSNQFNHAIACVPLQNDTIWLECTSQTVAPGYMGSFTGNRKALIIADDGGHLVNTPIYGETKNQKNRKTFAKIDENGHLTATMQTAFSGLEQDDIHGMINGLSKEEQLKYLKKGISLATYDVQSYKYQQLETALPVITEDIQLTAQHYATVSGKRIFIVPNILSQNILKLPTSEERKFPIIYPYAFIHTDTTVIQIPVGYTIEAQPQPTILNNQFGKYTISFQLKDNQLFCYRKYERTYGRFPQTAYKDLVAFYEAMYKADRGRVVLVKKEQ